MPFEANDTDTKADSYQSAAIDNPGRDISSAPEMESFFETTFGITDRDLDRILSRAMSGGADFADVFFQHVKQHRMVMEEGRVDKASVAVNFGLGVRVVKDGRTGYSYTQEPDARSMLETARQAAVLAGTGPDMAKGQGEPHYRFEPGAAPDLYPMEVRWSGVDVDTRMTVLQRVGNRIDRADPRVQKVTVSLGDLENHILVANSRGIKRADLRPMVALMAKCTAESKGRRETNHHMIRGRSGLELLTSAALDDLADRVVKSTLLLFEACPVPPGEMPCILDRGQAGILLHEAIGHGLEADFNRNGVSTFAGRLGDRVASEEVTILDSGLYPGLNGSIRFDDEGSDSRETILVDRGRLVSYLHDRLTADHFKTGPTGSGRRQDFRYPPMPRMRTTYMAQGPRDPEEILGSVKKGLLAETFTNGAVHIGPGDFTFYVKMGWAVENGKRVHPVKDVNVIGNGPEILSRIVMVGSDPPLERRFDGSCGKLGQSVPVSCGLPTTLVSAINVGGANG